MLQIHFPFFKSVSHVRAPQGVSVLCDSSALSDLVCSCAGMNKESPEPMP